MPVSQFVSWLRLLSPLIEPDVRFSRIRLSDWFHVKAHAGVAPYSAFIRTIPILSWSCVLEKRWYPRDSTL